MSAQSLQVVGERVPVFQGQDRVRGLYSYLSSDGTLGYVWSRRVDGRMKRGKLQTTGTVSRPNKTAAVNEFVALFSDIERGTVVIGDRSLTLRALVEDFFARERGPLASLSPGTVNVYSIRLEKHVLGRVGNKRAADLKVQDVRRLIDAWVREGQSGSGIRVTVAALQAVYRHGILRCGLASSPVRLERGELPSGKRQTEPRYLTIEEVERLLQKLSDQSRPVAAVCFFAAARISEALDLRWSDVNFDASEIRIPGTKTAASDAVVRLLDPLAAELRAHRERQARLGFDRIQPDSRVFQTVSGKRPIPRGLLRAINAASVRAGLVPEGAEKVGAHDLRHSLAGHAYALGLSHIEVSKLLRHSSPATTMASYSGVSQSVVLAAGDKLAGEMGGRA